MRFAIMALGWMGLGLGELAVQRGREVVAWDGDQSARDGADRADMRSVAQLEDVPRELPSPRVVLLSVPHARPSTRLEQARTGGIGAGSDLPPDPAQTSTHVEDSDEVKWVVKWATDRDIPVPVTGMSQQVLMSYRDLDWPAATAVTLLRDTHGGHPVHRADDDPERA